MLTEKEAFFRFITEDECSSKNFYKAVKYFSQATFDERNQFYQKLKNILSLCLDEMTKCHSNNLEIAKKIYQKYGINDYYFKYAFRFFAHNQSENSLSSIYLDLLNDEDKEKIFEDLKQSLWDNKKFTEIAKEYHLSQTELDQLIIDYAVRHYKISADDFKKYKLYYRNFRRFLSLEKINRYQRRNAYYYYQNYALPEEKEEFEYLVQNYLVKIIRYSNNPEALDAFLSESNLSDYDLYFFTTIQSIDFNVKEKLFARFKTYYDGCLKYNFSVVDIKREALKLKLKSEDYVFLARVYAKEVLHIDGELERIVENHYTKPIYDVLKNIQDETDLAKIEAILDQEKVKPSDISVFCYCVNSKLPKENQQSLERKLLECLRVVQSRRIAEGRKKTSVASPDYSLYHEYLNQDLNFIHFCNLKGINFKSFRYVYKTLKNPELAVKLEERIQKESIDNEKAQVYWCKELIEAIQNGITINGINRKFNLFDYFYYFGDYQIHRFFLPKLPLSQPEKTILSKFFAPLKRVNYMNKNVVLRSVYEFYPQLDKKGKPIKGTGRILSEEELQEIVDIFEARNIPLYDILISMAVRCYANHSLIPEMSLQRK